MEPGEQVDFEAVRIFENGGVEEDLVRFAETEVQFVLVEEFFVGLAKFTLLALCINAQIVNNEDCDVVHTFARLSFIATTGV